MINTKADRTSLYLTCSNLAVVNKLKPLLEKQGYILRPSDSKFIPRLESASWDTPWIYVQSASEARCDIYHRVFYNTLHHIHSYCRSCWKVVVRPRTLTELLDLYELEKVMGVNCKCGLELRSTVCGNYGGYFYTRSIGEGLERYEQVRKLVDENISPEVPVILKRYCTEFELGGEGIEGSGPSDLTPPISDAEREYELLVESLFPSNPGSVAQPKHILAAIIQNWIHHAYSIGDLSYLECTGGVPLRPNYVTYHDK